MPKITIPDCIMFIHCFHAEMQKSDLNSTDTNLAPKISPMMMMALVLKTLVLIAPVKKIPSEMEVAPL